MLHIDRKRVKQEVHELLVYLGLTLQSNRFQFIVELNDHSKALSATVNYMKSICSQVGVLINTISLEVNTLDEDVASKMYSSTSIIKFTGNGDDNAYSKKLIDVITVSQNEEWYINRILSYMKYLDIKERHVLYAYYLIGISLKDISVSLDCTIDYVRKLKSKGLIDLAILLPDKLLINDASEKF